MQFRIEAIKRDIAESLLKRDFPVAEQEGGTSPVFLLLRRLYVTLRESPPEADKPRIPHPLCLPRPGGVVEGYR